MIKKTVIFALFLCLVISLYAQPGPESGNVDWNGEVGVFFDSSLLIHNTSTRGYGLGM